jgi:hypothetical protein
MQGGFVFVRVPKVILIVVLVGYLLNEQRLGVLVIGPSPRKVRFEVFRKRR